MYLGVKFFWNGKYAQEVKHRVRKGNMCMNLISKHEFGKIRDLAMHKYLFKTKLLLVMHYRWEPWGFRESEELERMQRNYFKIVLRAHKSTHTIVLKED